MIDVCGAKRVGTSDEIAYAAEFLLSEKAGFITGMDLLIDGGTIAAINSEKWIFKSNNFSINFFYFYFHILS